MGLNRSYHLISTRNELSQRPQTQPVQAISDCAFVSAQQAERSRMDEIHRQLEWETEASALLEIFERTSGGHWWSLGHYYLDTPM